MTSLLKGQNTLKRVKEALTNNGYGHDDITSAKFVGLNPRGAEIHKITFPDPETGEQDEGNVYLEEKDGKLVAEF